MTSENTSSAPIFVAQEAPHPGVLLMRLSRPERRNALNVALIAALGAAFDAAECDARVRCVVLAGEGKSFCAGADIEEMNRLGFAALELPERRIGLRSVERFSKPVIAAVEGLALGGGLELALLADLVVAGRSARFGLPEVKIGLMPGDGGTQRLTRAVGRARASRMILTGEPIDAAEAVDVGLIAELVEDGAALGRALDVARGLAQGPLLAQQMAKRAILAADEVSLSAGIDIERHAAARTFAHPDAREGIGAFMGKRPPRFGAA